MSIFQSRTVKRKLEAAFAGREPLDDQSFYEMYFRSRGVSADVVVGVRRILEEEFDVDLSRLSAEDDFARNLGFIVDYGSLDAVEVVVESKQDPGKNVPNRARKLAERIERDWKKSAKKAGIRH